MKIAIIYANLKGNIGDLAILHAMLVELSGRHTNSEIHVFPHQAHATDEKRLEAFRAETNINFTVMEPIHSTNATLIEILCEGLGLYGYIARSLDQWHTQKSNKNASQFHAYTAIYVAGGHQWSGIKGQSMLNQIAAIHRVNSAISTYPFSIESDFAQSGRSKLMIDRLGLLNKPLLVRDERTRSQLEGLGLQARHCADIAFQLRNVRPTRANNGVEKNTVILAVTGRKKSFPGELASVLSKLDGSQWKTTLMTTCEHSEGQLMKEAARRSGVEVYAPVTWQECISRMQRAEVVVSNRLHGLILASLAETPIIPVLNREKVESFVLDAKLPFAVHSLADVTTQNMAEAVACKQQIADALEAYLQRYEGQTIPDQTK